MPLDPDHVAAVREVVDDELESRGQGIGDLEKVRLEGLLPLKRPGVLRVLVGTLVGELFDLRLI